MKWNKRILLTFFEKYVSSKNNANYYFSLGDCVEFLRQYLPVKKYRFLTSI